MKARARVVLVLGALLALGASAAIAGEQPETSQAATTKKQRSQGSKARSAKAASTATPAKQGAPIGRPPSTLGPPSPGIVPDGLYHGRSDRFAFGGHGEVRFGHDRERGLENPEWLSFPRIEAFALTRVHRRAQVMVDAAYDRTMDQLVLERAMVDWRVGSAMSVHAGVMLPPLGRANREHQSPRAEFSDRSLVATDLVGAPVSMFGIGVHGLRGGAGRPALTYEVDIVNGYDDGVVTEAAPGTRIPSGRNTAGDNNGMPALVGRVALRPRAGSEFGLAAYTGQYNSTEIEGVTVDGARWLHMAVVDGAATVAGCRVVGEAGMAVVDVNPTLRALYPEEQWGAALTVSRRVLAPLLPKWRNSSLTLAIRGDAVDFDRGLPGDSRSRVSAALNIRPSDRAVIRGQWFYEVVRDRFDNPTPAAGISAGGAIYF
jgi:hypothetical protein